ncbi:MAG TPA: glycosyltransferase family 4 protein [Solirubrobacterales bacterium]|nr:glycosyltransferase family 4 protein [Solirubrobacterales bacterium]
MKLAYVCSEYPAISHTFVLREIEALRELGAEIATFSLRRTPEEKLLSERDRRAAATTVSILPPRWGRLLRAHLGAALRSPRAYFATLAYALGLAPPGLRGRLWQLFYFAEAILLWSECDQRSIHHLHVHLANAAADAAMVAVRYGNARSPGRWSWSFTMHGPTEFWDVRHYRLREKLESASFVVCISEFCRSQLMSLCEPERWDRLRVVHCGIPVEDFTRRTPPSEPGPGARILYIGRLVPEKGQTVLLEAIAELTHRGHEVTATIAGEGALKPELEKMAERLGLGDRIEFPGAVGQHQLQDLYEAATVFCLPSFGEGVPIVLMEAMAMEVPPISTRIAGIPELIEHERGGLLVPPGRADALAGALESLLTDPDFHRELATAGRAKVLEEFDTDRSAGQLLAIFEEMLEGRAPESRPAVPFDSYAPAGGN